LKDLQKHSLDKLLCLSCNILFYEEQYFQKHIEEQHPDLVRYKCKCCDHLFETVEKAEEHIRLEKKQIKQEIVKEIKETIENYLRQFNEWTVEVEKCGSIGKNTDVSDSDIDVVVYINQIDVIKYLLYHNKILETFEKMIVESLKVPVKKKRNIQYNLFIKKLKLIYCLLLKIMM